MKRAKAELRFFNALGANAYGNFFWGVKFTHVVRLLWSGIADVKESPPWGNRGKSHGGRAGFQPWRKSQGRVCCERNPRSKHHEGQGSPNGQGVKLLGDQLPASLKCPVLHDSQSTERA